MWYRGVGRLLTLTLSLLVAPLIADAQQPTKMHRIGRLSVGSPPARPDPSVEALRQSLHDRGYVEGHNLVLECRYAEESEARLRELATDLVRLPVDVIAAGSAPADALLVPPMPMFFTQRKRILDVAAQRRLPVMATERRRVRRPCFIPRRWQTFNLPTTNWQVE